MPVASAGLAHAFLDRARARRLTWALATRAGGGAILLAASIDSWGAPGALTRGSLVGLSGLHVALAGLAAAFGLLLAIAQRLGPRAGSGRRTIEAQLALSVPAAAVLLASGPIRAGVHHGLTALTAGNSWFEHISEYRPMLFSCEGSLKEDAWVTLVLLGLTIPAGALAVPSLVRRWREGTDRDRLLVLACWVGIFLPLALARRRFAAYATPALAVVAAEGLWVVASRVGGARRAVLLGGALLTVSPSLVGFRAGVTGVPEEQVDAARWISSRPRRALREGASTPWSLGHVFLSYGGIPVVASPFGTDVGPEAMTFTSRLHLTPDPEEVEALAAGRRLGWIVLADPAHEAIIDQGLPPPKTPRLATMECSLLGGAIGRVDDRYQDLAVPRLFYRDGLTRPGSPAAPFTRLRLVYETLGLGTVALPETSLKVFEWVPGATLGVTGADPWARVDLATRVTTRFGRAFTWSVGTLAGADGTATFRLPYASGVNGTSKASPWQVSSGTATTALELSDRDVVEGSRRSVALAPR